jgi:hypothetical protein
MEILLVDLSEFSLQVRPFPRELFSKPKEVLGSKEKATARSVRPPCELELPGEQRLLDQRGVTIKRDLSDGRECDGEGERLKKRRFSRASLANKTGDARGEIERFEILQRVNVEGEALGPGGRCRESEGEEWGLRRVHWEGRVDATVAHWT